MKSPGPASGTLHESFAREHAPAGGTDRAFGVVFAVVAGLVAVHGFVRGRPHAWPGAVAALVFASFAWARPAALAPLNRAWTRLGLLLQRVVQPVIMALLFYGVITPFAVVMRWTGRDALGLRIDRQARSYWTPRSDGEHADMTRQF